MMRTTWKQGALWAVMTALSGSSGSGCSASQSEPDGQGPPSGIAGGSAGLGAGTGGVGGGAAGSVGASGSAASPSAGVGGSVAVPVAGSGSAGTGGGAGAESQAGAGGEPDGGVIDSGDLVPGIDDLIAAPDGTDAAAGTMTDPTTLHSAITRIGAGHVIFLRGGTYAFAVQITVARDNSGQDGQPKTIAPYPGEAPVLDFSSQPYGSSGNARGLELDGSYWHVIGLTVMGSADNGIYVAGNDNVIEGCITHGNRDTGLQLGRYASSAATQAEWPSNNLILNCESYDNFDSPSGENADGFAAKLTVGPGNVFRGCVSHNNIDDGWDLYTKGETGPIGGVTIDQCIAHHNGKLTDGTSTGNGDQNGFKLGGEDIAVAHIVTRSVSFANGKDGFTWNSNPGAIRMINDLAFDNAETNYRFGDNSTPTEAVFTNNLSVRSSSGGTDDKHVGTDVSDSNCWSPSDNPTCAMSGVPQFRFPLSDPEITRSSDGNLDMSAFSLEPRSNLINAGVVPQGELPFDLSYYVDAPDLGAVETQ